MFLLTTARVCGGGELGNIVRKKINQLHEILPTSLNDNVKCEFFTSSDIGNTFFIL